MRRMLKDTSDLRDIHWSHRDTAQARNIHGTSTRWAQNLPSESAERTYTAMRDATFIGIAASTYARPMASEISSLVGVVAPPIKVEVRVHAIQQPLLSDTNVLLTRLPSCRLLWPSVNSVCAISETSQAHRLHELDGRRDASCPDRRDLIRRSSCNLYVCEKRRFVLSPCLAPFHPSHAPYHPSSIQLFKQTPTNLSFYRSP